MENKIENEVDKFINEIKSKRRKKETAYDYISKNYNSFTKEELAVILKEFIYESCNSIDFDINMVIENLIDED